MAALAVGVSGGGGGGSNGDVNGMKVFWTSWVRPGLTSGAIGRSRDAVLSLVGKAGRHTASGSQLEVFPHSRSCSPPSFPPFASASPMSLFQEHPSPFPISRTHLPPCWLPQPQTQREARVTQPPPPLHVGRFHSPLPATLAARAWGVGAESKRLSDTLALGRPWEVAGLG